ncbi:NAD-dependent epimerase/dehydratase family protein [Amnibacterium setariae]|uniref:NAD(P)-dependent oxidoreductase n=1 Tax=Amnibacterium setariae TaxID=2306585 RepID=A0A3A1TTR1_9MICO|nr:NAD(P)-dependent oxidoreductase [Amnibacterium setariae]RIX27612.1 NAD(P)-dependent oxidoreductase [Amnibacterium setariae]
MRIIVTGGSGKLGSTVVASLKDAGHTVVVFDRAARRGEGVPVDLTDAGQVLDAVAGVEDLHDGVDAIVHLAAIPAPGIAPDVLTFENNILSTHHVLQAARRAGVRRIVTASSETLLGLPMDEPPAAFPVDEEVVLPNSTYSMTKHLEEQMAITFCRWDPMLSITAMRFSNVMVEEDYAGFEAWQDDARLRKWNAWGYIDARDAAVAIELALQVRGPGFERYIIANADTVMRRPSAELAAEVFPDVPFTRPVEGRATLLSIDKARRDLGWEPAHSWLDAQG